MRLALISDIHSNIQALDAVLEVIDARDVDAVYCLGDIVGYGADPKLCLERVRERCSGIVLGNHDLAVASEPHRAQLPRAGKKAARHNAAALEIDEIAFLTSLPYRLTEHGCTFVHATPLHPEHWIRLDTYTLSQAQFGAFDGDICFVGHTHRPAIISDRLGVLQVRRGHRFLVNVGSVGQPRDGDPRACFCLIDLVSFTCWLERVEYDVEAAADRIREEKLPSALADRLELGQ